jgi:hypothetical protein
MATVEAFKRGDEVLSKYPGGSIMTVLAVEGLKVRCTDSQNTQYWFDTIMLERYGPSPSHAETLSAEASASIHCRDSVRSVGNGRKPISAPPQPGCCSAALPQLIAQCFGVPSDDRHGARERRVMRTLLQLTHTHGVARCRSQRVVVAPVVRIVGAAFRICSRFPYLFP